MMEAALFISSVSDSAVPCPQVSLLLTIHGITSVERRMCQTGAVVRWSVGLGIC